MNNNPKSYIPFNEPIIKNIYNKKKLNKQYPFVLSWISPFIVHIDPIHMVQDYILIKITWLKLMLRNMKCTWIGGAITICTVAGFCLMHFRWIEDTQFGDMHCIIRGDTIHVYFLDWFMSLKASLTFCVRLAVEGGVSVVFKPLIFHLRAAENSIG